MNLTEFLAVRLSFLREVCGFIWAARLYAGPRRRFYWIHIAMAAPGAVRQLKL